VNEHADAPEAAPLAAILRPPQLAASSSAGRPCHRRNVLECGGRTERLQLLHELPTATRLPGQRMRRSAASAAAVHCMTTMKSVPFPVSLLMP
jgi:hypothetical protein